MIGRPVDGLSVVSVNGPHRAIMLVGDLGSNELAQLAGIVSLPLVQRLGDVAPNRAKPTASLFAPPVQELVRAFARRPDLKSLLTERLPAR